MAKKKIKVQRNNGNSTWSNTTMEQPYLMPGTPEYDEYKDDLKEHDPFQSDDIFHNELEDKNSKHRSELLAKSASGEVTPSRTKAISQNMKQSQFGDVKKAAKKQASKTEGKDDDQKVNHMSADDLASLVFDDAITGDEFLPKALSKFL